MTDADLVQVLLPEESGGVLGVDFAEGEAGGETIELTFDVQATAAGRVYTTGQAASADELHDGDCPLRDLGYGPELLDPARLRHQRARRAGAGQAVGPAALQRR